MTSPILSPGDPGYDKWLSEYRERKAWERLIILVVLATCSAVGYSLWLGLDRWLDLGAWAEYSVSYLGAGVVFCLYAIAVHRKALAELRTADLSTGDTLKVFFGSLLVLIFWPLSALVLSVR